MPFLDVSIEFLITVFGVATALRELLPFDFAIDADMDLQFRRFKWFRSKFFQRRPRGSPFEGSCSRPIGSWGCLMGSRMIGACTNFKIGKMGQMTKVVVEVETVAFIFNRA